MLSVTDGVTGELGARSFLTDLMFVGYDAHEELKHSAAILPSIKVILRPGERLVPKGVIILTV